MSSRARDDLVLLGRVSGLFGIKGWIKVHSYTRERAGILDYDVWFLKSNDGSNDISNDKGREFDVAEGRMQGEGVIARLAGIDDRDAASALVGMDISVARSELPKLKRGEVYWADLEGLKVINLEGVELGTVSHLFETGGANDVVVVKGERERLIPYVAQAIREVDLVNGILRVDWDESF
jgi:16S rRNA processing protein RimM